VTLVFYLRTSSSWAPVPRSTRKRRDRYSDSIRSKGFEKSLEWNDRRVHKPDGTLWVTGTHHIIFSIEFALQTLECRIINQIDWQKPDPPPNALLTDFTH
jgi:hypothetical protein